ncbi:anti-sigma factor [Methylobacterium nigriterrae]|uniref:anti-sigma factor n=1 Tax=Methylobacterium nigriterrae TaxID=3127512 RepID=UPI003D67F097
MGPDERDLRAAEYVLGTLSPSERAAFELERTVDPAAAAAVRAWEGRLAPLVLAIPSEPPSPRVWEAIVRALPGGAANDNRIRDLGRQVRRWRLATAGAGLVAAALAAFIVVGPRLAPPAGPPAGARYVAVVTSGGALPALIVNVDTAAGTASVRPVKAETPAGRSLQLWYVGAGEAPKPLGLIGADASRVELPAAARTGEGVFAVSVEPPGGSPTGQPTGQVIYTGQLIRD